jgi:hypothetical protein
MGTPAARANNRADAAEGPRLLHVKEVDAVRLQPPIHSDEVGEQVGQRLAACAEVEHRDAHRRERVGVGSLRISDQNGIDLKAARDHGPGKIYRMGLNASCATVP